jgi:hypothetical protein
MGKRPVYNGYDEAYMTGKEIKEYLSDAYGRFGRHHEMISSTRIKIDSFKKLQDDKLFRIFYNEFFFKIMDAETDSSLYFIAYTKERPKWAKD